MSAMMLVIMIVIPIVVMVVPIVLGVPAMLVLIPPAMIVVPAVVARFAKLVPGFVRLLALGPMMFDGFMEVTICLGDSLLAVVVTGTHTRCAGEEQESRQRPAGQRYFPRTKYPFFSRPKNYRMKFCLHPVLLYV
jgi:hypothetical protein